jgi:hypothetical protein
MCVTDSVDGDRAIASGNSPHQQPSIMQITPPARRHCKSQYGRMYMSATGPWWVRLERGRRAIGSDWRQLRSARERPTRMTYPGYESHAGRRSTALTHRCRPSAPRTRPNHSCRVFHPPIELACIRPGGCVHRDRWIDVSAICFGTLQELAGSWH